MLSQSKKEKGEEKENREQPRKQTKKEEEEQPNKSDKKTIEDISKLVTLYLENH